MGSRRKKEVVLPDQTTRRVWRGLEELWSPRSYLETQEPITNNESASSWASPVARPSVTITNVSYPKEQFTPFFEAILFKTIWILTAETCNQVSLQMSWTLESHKSGKKEALTDTVSASDVQDNTSLALTLEEKGGRWRLSKGTWDSISVARVYIIHCTLSHKWIERHHCPGCSLLNPIQRTKPTRKVKFLLSTSDLNSYLLTSSPKGPFWIFSEC